MYISWPGWSQLSCSFAGQQNFFDEFLCAKSPLHQTIVSYEYWQRFWSISYVRNAFCYFLGDFYRMIRQKFTNYVRFLLATQHVQIFLREQILFLLAHVGVLKTQTWKISAVYVFVVLFVYESVFVCVCVCLCVCVCGVSLCVCCVCDVKFQTRSLKFKKIKF